MFGWMPLVLQKTEKVVTKWSLGGHQVLTKVSSRSDEKMDLNCSLILNHICGLG